MLAEGFDEVGNVGPCLGYKHPSELTAFPPYALVLRPDAACESTIVDGLDTIDSVQSHSVR